MIGIELSSDFMASVGRLEAAAQASVLATMTRFGASPDHPGLRLHKIQHGSGKVYSISDNMDLRVILYRKPASWVFLHVDHHDRAYDWVRRRELGPHRKTGAFQIIEVEETIKTVERVIERCVPAQAPPLFANASDDFLLSLGVPESWLPTVRRIRDDDHLLVVCESLPGDVAERLMDLAAGEFVTPPVVVIGEAVADPGLFQPCDLAELEAVLKAPMTRWLAFLHPEQKRLVSRDWSGPARVTGSAGTGKTVVAMHRAARLAREGRRVLLTTYTNALVHNLKRSMAQLCGPEVLERITIATVHKQALAVVKRVNPKAAIASRAKIESHLKTLAPRHAPDHDPKFILSEWDAVVRMQGIETWESYRRARRTGRGRALGVRERKRLWRVFEPVLVGLKERNRFDWPGLCAYACDALKAGRVVSEFSAVLVDEVQDLTPPDLRFLKALCLEPGGLLLCGDVGQRIYPGGFSLAALGLETRGRAAVLRINYRTTAQIRKAADRLVSLTEQDDMDEGCETRGVTHAMRRGLEPQFVGYANESAELSGAVERVKAWLAAGLEPEAVGVFGRTEPDLEELQTLLERAGVPTVRIAKKEVGRDGKVHLVTMHSAKGLEFKVVLVFGVSAERLPHRSVYSFQDPMDRERALAAERRLLYVAMTRARDQLAVTWSGEPSAFLEDLPVV